MGARRGEISGSIYFLCSVYLAPISPGHHVFPGESTGESKIRTSELEELKMKLSTGWDRRQICKRCSIFLVIREIHNKATRRHHRTPIRVAETLKTEHSSWWQGRGGNGALKHPGDDMAPGENRWAAA